SRRCRATLRPRTRARLRSPNRTAPRLGRSARCTSRSSVLLPAPEWPVMKSISPSPTSKLTSESAAWPPGYCLLTLSKRRTLIGWRGWGTPGKLSGVALRGRAAGRLQEAAGGRSRRVARDELAQAAADARDQAAGIRWRGGSSRGLGRDMARGLRLRL